MTRTIRLRAAIEFDHTFRDDELDSRPDGHSGEFLPMDAAFEAVIFRLDLALRHLAPKRIELDLAEADSRGTANRR